MKMEKKVEIKVLQVRKRLLWCRSRHIFFCQGHVSAFTELPYMKSFTDTGSNPDLNFDKTAVNFIVELI